jgi:Icc-related predicted phosphoesterase
VLPLVACGAPPPATFAPKVAHVHRFVVAGDLQRTAPFLEFWREQNDPERERVVAAIAAEQPDLVLLTGDCVFNGASDAQWAAFDALMTPIRARGVPVTTAFGNHEYWLFGREMAEARVFPRFPLMHEQHWYVVPLGAVRIIVLDSNESKLTEPTWSSQARWFEHTLEAYDADASVRGVLVAFHHPPYTNSTVTGDEEHVQRAFVPPFARARKTLALLNGHVHSYERYERAGKTYVVSGGGGGPRARLATGDERRHPDDLFSGPALRDFNYTTYTIGTQGVAAEVHTLEKGATQWRVADRFELAFP